jgi:hypothetical protein
MFLYNPLYKVRPWRFLELIYLLMVLCSLLIIPVCIVTGPPGWFTLSWWIPALQSMEPDQTRVHREWRSQLHHYHRGHMFCCPNRQCRFFHWVRMPHRPIEPLCPNCGYRMYHVDPKLVSVEQRRGYKIRGLAQDRLFVASGLNRA